MLASTRAYGDSIIFRDRVRDLHWITQQVMSCCIKYLSLYTRTDILHYYKFDPLIRWIKELQDWFEYIKYQRSDNIIHGV